MSEKGMVNWYHRKLTPPDILKKLRESEDKRAKLKEGKQIEPKKD